LLQVGVGVKINQIFGYRMDIANAAGVPDVRILNSLVQYGDNSYISVEINKVEINKKERKPLLMSPENLPTGDFKFPIGRDNFNNEVVWDIGNPSTPHLLVAGASGSGKSVALTTIIEAALKKGMKVGILDPKFEFVDLDGRDGVTVVNGQDEVEAFMAEKVAEMDEIYQNKGAKGNTNNKQLIVFDEASDCFTRQRRPGKGEDFKTLEDNTLLLAQKARSAGIHMVLSSQRFSVKVMTGDAKANFPTRLCLTVASAVDSKVMLDEDGAEKLNGKGDALYRSPEMGEPVRIQTYMMK
jgi:S-DNA-T family DNA segregation ATPase FtsK/SpoIIIE